MLHSPCAHLLFFTQNDTDEVQVYIGTSALRDFRALKPGGERPQVFNADVLCAHGNLAHNLRAIPRSGEFMGVLDSPGNYFHFSPFVSVFRRMSRYFPARQEFVVGDTEPCAECTSKIQAEKESQEVYCFRELFSFLTFLTLLCFNAGRQEERFAAAGEV